MSLFRIVIPSRDPLKFGRVLSELVYRSGAALMKEILLVADGSWELWDQDLPVYSNRGLQFLEGKAPFIYARNVNTGLRWVAHQSDCLVVMGDDVLVPEPIFGKMAEVMQDNPKLGILSPLIDGTCWTTLQDIKQTPYDPEFGTLIEEKSFLSFVCVMIRKELLDVCGGLDEGFDGYGYEDLDYCLRAQDAGYTLGVWTGAYVEHNPPGLPSSYRTREDFKELSRKNQSRFYDKWGKENLEKRWGFPLDSIEG